MLISNWFDFLLHTFFIGFAFIFGVPFSIWLFIHGLTSKDLEISWRALFKEGELGTSTPLQDIIGSIMILSSMLYGFFGMGMFWDYLEAASLFLMNQ